MYFVDSELSSCIWVLRDQPVYYIAPRARIYYINNIYIHASFLILLCSNELLLLWIMKLLILNDDYYYYDF